jgi:3-methyladenine DNA glycosylase AlkD
LRAIGVSKNSTLRAEARATAERLAASSDKTARWNGKDALRAFAKADKGKAK